MMRLLLSLWKFLPLGKKIQLLLMRLFQDEFLVAVSGVIFNKEKKVLLFKHSYRRIPWSLPGGYLKGKEHPREGLTREIFEESGLTVRIDHVIKTRTDRRSARLEICYAGSYYGGFFKASSEVTAAKFFPIDSLPLIPPDQLRLIQKAGHLV